MLKMKKQKMNQLEVACEVVEATIEVQEIAPVDSPKITMRDFGNHCVLVEGLIVGATYQICDLYYEQPDRLFKATERQMIVQGVYPSLFLQVRVLD